MKTRVLILSFLLLAAVLGGCGSKQGEAPGAAARVLQYSELGPPPSGKSGNSSSIGQEPRKRMVIMTADLDLRVANCDTALARIQAIAGRNSGFVVRSSTTLGYQGAASGTATLRIPTTSFKRTLSEVKTLAEVVESETVKGNDVTEEFYDVSARLKNKEKVEARFRQVLKSAKTVKDILAVESALGNVREQIEQLEGRKKYLADQVDFSTIHVRLHEPLKAPAGRGSGLIARLGTAFHDGLSGLEEVTAIAITVTIALGPLVVVLAFVVFYALKAIKRRRRRAKEPVRTDPD